MMFWKTKFFEKEDEKRIIQAIRQAEKDSSGEVRLYVESYCHKLTHERALEIFKKLKMHATRERNAVLIYIAMKDRKFAIFGDEGIHSKMGFSFWQNEAAILKSHFQNNQITEGICEVIVTIGKILSEHFPYQDDDKNELPDKPVYGK